MSKDHQDFAITFRLLNKREMANLLGCTTRTIDRMVADRTIPFLKIPTGFGRRGTTRFHPQEIEKWLKAHNHDTDLQPQPHKRESSQEFWAKFRATRDLYDQKNQKR